MKKFTSQPRLVFISAHVPQYRKKLRQDEDISDYSIRQVLLLIIILFLLGISIYNLVNNSLTPSF